MKTRSGKTYFSQGEERCPVCLDSSWAAVGETRLLCVEGCGCPVPSTHAHCYLSMAATCDVRGDGRRMTKCPACTCDVKDSMPEVLRKAQHNHNVLCESDPDYSTERSVMMHSLMRGAQNMVACAREFDRDTRDIALRMADEQNVVLALTECALALIDSGADASTVRARVASIRTAVIRMIRENVSRMNWRDYATQDNNRRNLESGVFRDAGLRDSV